MMELIRGWLLGITGAAILTSVADGLMPEGGIRQVGKLVCGLVILGAVVSPLAGRQELGVSGLWDAKEAYCREQILLLQEQTDEQMKGIIEEELSAYSMDKARQNGLSCSIQVTCAAEEGGIWLPKDIKIYGVLTQQEKQLLIRLPIEDLGVDSAQIIFQAGGS